MRWGEINWPDNIKKRWENAMSEVRKYIDIHQSITEKIKREQMRYEELLYKYMRGRA